MDIAPVVPDNKRGGSPSGRNEEEKKVGENNPPSAENVDPL